MTEREGRFTKFGGVNGKRAAESLTGMDSDAEGNQGILKKMCKATRNFEPSRPFR